MELNLILFIGFGIFLILLFLIVYFKDLESNAKFERYARSIEDLNRQVHQLRQSLAHKQEEDKILKDEILFSVHQKVQDEINTHIVPLLDSLKEIENVIYSFKDDQLQRMTSLENKTKSINLPNSTTSNEKQVIQAYNSGKKTNQIARDLRIGLGEVEFILKMNNLL